MPFTYEYPHPAVATDIAVFTLRRGGLNVLLIERGADPYKGAWALPGGFLQPDEELDACALRELREETGVEAELIGFVAPVEAIERDRQGRVRLHIVIAAHAARWVSGEPQTGPEARDIRWVSEDEIDTLPTTPGLPGLLRRAFALARDSGA